MQRERYKDSIYVVSDNGRAYEVLHFVTIVDGREGVSFYRLANGIPVYRISDDEFEVGMIEKQRTKRIIG
jgi:hypothetical protein